MRFILFALFAACLLVAPSAYAAEVNCGEFVTLTLPDDWEITRKVETDADGFAGLEVGKKDKSVTVSIMGGPSSGSSAKELAQRLAEQSGAMKDPAEFQGQYGFPTGSTDKGVTGFCFLSTDKDKFLFTCVEGEIGNASSIVTTMKSDKYPDLPVK